MPQLSTSLIFNTVLTRLDLHYNDITQIGATSLAQMLKRNFTLVTLDLSYNSEGCMLLLLEMMMIDAQVWGTLEQKPS